MGGGYESDSSEAEEYNRYTETNVLLGYASKDGGASNEMISKIGGKAVCVPASKHPPPPQKKKKKKPLCNCLILLLVPASRAKEICTS